MYIFLRNIAWPFMNSRLLISWQNCSRCCKTRIKVGVTLSQAYQCQCQWDSFILLCKLTAMFVGDVPMVFHCSVLLCNTYYTIFFYYITGIFQNFDQFLRNLFVAWHVFVLTLTWKLWFEQWMVISLVWHTYSKRNKLETMKQNQLTE